MLSAEDGTPCLVETRDGAQAGIRKRPKRRKDGQVLNVMSFKLSTMKHNGNPPQNRESDILSYQNKVVL